MDEMQNTIASTFTAFASQRMAKSLENIARCVEQLSEEQMRCRGGEHENSVVNLLLHLEGNIRQWILSGVAGQPDERDRDAEFAPDAHTSGADALAMLSATIGEARALIEGIPPARLFERLSGHLAGVSALEGVPLIGMLEPSAIQHLAASQGETVLVATAHVFSHLEYHTGQIVLLTKQMMGHDLDLSTPRRR